MRKSVLFTIITFCLFSLALSGAVSAAFDPSQGLVPCGQPGQPRCELSDLFRLIENVYDFIVWWMAVPLATLAIIVGGILLMLSAGNPGLAHAAKRVIWGAVTGILLIFLAWLIIHSILWALGVNPRFIP